MTQAPRTGELAGPERLPCARPVTITAEKAAREALAAYLACADFTLGAGWAPVGALTAARTLRLVRVLVDFPGPEIELAYPSASITEGAATRHTGGFVPVALEDTWDPVSETVVWCLGRAEGLLQVDFWADSVAMREALGAALPGLLSPGEGMHGVHLVLPPAYASAVARFSLEGMQLVDLPDPAWAQERRLSASVRYDVPLLVTRRATALSPRAPLTTDSTDS